MAIQRQSQNPAVSLRARESQTVEPKPKQSHLRSFLSRAVMALIVLSCVIAAGGAIAAVGSLWQTLEQAKSVRKEAPAEQNDQAQNERKAGSESNLAADLDGLREKYRELDEKIKGWDQQRVGEATGTASRNEAAALTQLNGAIDNLVASLRRLEQTANPAQAVRQHP